MLSVAEAREKVLELCRPPAAAMIPLARAALGCVLAESIASDLDMPPFDKSLMDGFAVRAADLTTGKATLAVLEEIGAGITPRLPVGAGQATRIMTGAPVPNGADAVVMIERTRMLDEETVEIEGPAREGQNILRRGREMTRGEIVLNAGAVLRPQEFGILASVGRVAVSCFPPPRVAILATGDELVEGSTLPGPGQIRNSNAPMLLAQAARAGAGTRSLGIARDRLESLRPLVEEGLRTSEILVLSGGVSAGKFDLVPEVLREAGVTAHFHKVAMKPGKPLFFGTCERAEGKRLVFGLPGNPVSSFVCFELFLRPAIRRLSGFRELDLPRAQARFLGDFRHDSDRPTYHPAMLASNADGWQVEPAPWFGSADLRAFLQANSLLVLPPGSHQWRGGDRIEVLRLDG